MLQQPRQDSATDGDPQTAHALRMREVDEESTRTLSHMLTTVLGRAQLTSTNGGEGRFQGYQPEKVYRAVQSFTVLGKTAVLTSLLDTHFEEYAEAMRKQFLALESTLVGTNASGHPTTDASLGGEGTDEADKKRRRLCEGEGPSTVSTRPSETSRRCFLALVDVWRRLVRACEEVHTVWASFSYRYKTCFRAKSRSPRDSDSALLTLVELGGTTSRETSVLAAAVAAFSEAVLTAKTVMMLARDGYVAAIIADVAASHPIPSLGAPLEKESHREEEEEGREREKESAFKERQQVANQCQTDIRLFTQFCLAAGLYKSQAQAAIVEGIREYYTRAAFQMYTSEVSCRDYFVFAQEALAQERARASSYLHPHTAPLLTEAAEKALLGEVGMEVVSRDFPRLFEESARAAEGPDGGGQDPSRTLSEVKDLDTLAIVWKLLSRCPHVQRDPVVQFFRRHIDELGTAAVDAITASVRHAPSSSSSSLSPSPSGQPPSHVGGYETAKEAVQNLLHFAHDAKLVSTRCFGPDQKTFFTQIDECLQRVLEPHQRVLVEVIAAFVDGVFKQIEAGELPGAYGKTSSAGGRKAAGPAAAAAASKSGDSSGDEEQREGGVRGQDGRRRGSGEDTLAIIAYVCAHFPTIDTFQQLHWRDMGRRLLNPNRSANLEAERYFLRILESICGNSLVSKFDGMVRDVSLSESLTAQYKAWVESKGAIALAPPANVSHPPQGSTRELVPIEAIDFGVVPRSLDLHLQFTTDGLWPPCEPFQIHLPTAMQQVLANVEQFYHRLYTQRVLTWKHPLSHGVLTARLRPGAPPRQLSGTLVQCLILLFLDEHLRTDTDAMTVKDLCEGLGVSLESPTVMSSLLGLCHERCRLLLPERAGLSSSSSAASAGLSILPTDTLRINGGFVFPSTKVRIPLPVRGVKLASAGGDLRSGGAGSAALEVEAKSGRRAEEEEESQVQEDKILRDEGHMIQIAIIRFMKSHGKARHEELVRHLQQTEFSFTVTMPMVKKVLDRLIDRGFVERRGTDVYHYVT